MHTRSEREMIAGVGARDVEPSWVREHARVAVRPTEQQRDRVSRGNLAPGDVDVAASGVRRHLDRAVEPQDLLDSGGP